VAAFEGRQRRKGFVHSEQAKKGEYPLLPTNRISRTGGLAARPRSCRIIACCNVRHELGWDAAGFFKERTMEGTEDGLLRVGFPGDWPQAGRGRWREGRPPGGALAGRTRRR